jgi:hypothetical protein
MEEIKKAGKGVVWGGGMWVVTHLMEELHLMEVPHHTEVLHHMEVHLHMELQVMDMELQVMEVTQVSMECTHNHIQECNTNMVVLTMLILLTWFQWVFLQ